MTPMPLGRTALPQRCALPLAAASIFP
jgi:hypothetical protein